MYMTICTCVDNGLGPLTDIDTDIIYFIYFDKNDTDIIVMLMEKLLDFFED